MLDAVVETGNPPDSTRCLAMLERHQEHYGAAPSHAAFDGGYASRDNLAQAKALGVEHVVVPQEERPQARAHDDLLVVRSAQALPRRHRSRDLLSEALLRAGALPLAWLDALQGLRALRDLHPQPGASGAAAATTDLIGAAAVDPRPET